MLPQQQGLNSECDGMVWRVDVGMSSGVLNAMPQVCDSFHFSICIMARRVPRSIPCHVAPGLH